MSVQITKEDREVCIRIHDASWYSKINDLDYQMRQQDFWDHESTQYSLDALFLVLTITSLISLPITSAITIGNGMTMI